MIRKLYLNFGFNIFSKALNLVFCILLLKIGGGFSFNYFPMVHLFLIQHGYKQATEFYREIDNFIKFRRFLQNIDGNYPLIEFDEGHHEECAICKEGMA